MHQKFVSLSHLHHGLNSFCAEPPCALHGILRHRIICAYYQPHTKSHKVAAGSAPLPLTSQHSSNTLKPTSPCLVSQRTAIKYWRKSAEQPRLERQGILILAEEDVYRKVLWPRTNEKTGVSKHCGVRVCAELPPLRSYSNVSVNASCCCCCGVSVN
jgi:hypothetical protein